MLAISVADEVSGPVLIFEGEADLTSAAQLSAILSARLSDGTRQLTIDISGLCFADAASIRVLVLTAKSLIERGGGLVLRRPQAQVARMLELLGADQVMTVCATEMTSP
jgi:anti-sigma B factor antagonist